MANDSLRAPLIKSAVLLVILSLLVYLTASSSDGSLWGSLGTLFMAVFRAAQLAVGLLLALGLCFIVLAAIFLGGLALISREAARQLLRRSGEAIGAKLSGLRSCLRPLAGSPVPVDLEEFGEKLRADYTTQLAAVRQEVDAALVSNGETILSLESRLAELEAGENLQPLAERMQGMELRVKEFGEAMDKLSAALPHPIPADLPGRVDGLGSLLAEIKTETIQLASEVGELTSRLTKQASGEPEEHRLHAHITDAGARQKLDELMTEALAAGMTHGQTVDFLVKGLDRKTGRVLTDHPSLTRDYIRVRRRRA